MNKTSKRIFIIIFLLFTLIIYLFNSTLIINSIISYSKIFLTKLFPSSFLFFLFSNLFIDYGLINLISTYFKINTSSLYIFLMSLISGFPSGSKYITELYQNKFISLSTSNKLLLSTHFPNPLFILGTVNLIIKDYLLSFKILLSLFLSNFCLFLLFYQKDKPLPNNYSPPPNFASSLTKAISSSFKILFTIYGINLFFYLFTVIITKYFSLSLYPYIILNAFFDLTKGISTLSLLSNKLIKSYLSIIFISFGSLSIHMQVKSILSDTKINYNFYLLGRFIATFIALIIFYILLKF